MTNRRMCLTLLPLLMLAAGCAGKAPSPTALPTPLPIPTSTATPVPPTSTPRPTPVNATAWTEEEIRFAFGSHELYGILTFPTTSGPYPAVVLISGSVSPSTGLRDGASARYHVDHARAMARSGFAVLRYDPPGVGQSPGERGAESLDVRTEEAIAALRYVQSRPQIRPDRVGLWADSQGAWVIEMAAARYPQDVAFIISVSGSGVRVADQQVYSIQAQSKAAGYSEEDITKATIFGRLLIDWQLTKPIYREANDADAQALDNGPWNTFMQLVYSPGEITAGESLQAGIGILKSIQDDPWAKYLYLKQVYIPQLESIPPEMAAAVRATVGPSLLNDPKEYLTRVRCPVLAVFGEEDLLQPTEQSAALYAQYLTEAGNKYFRIVVIPGVGHSILLSMPAYSEALSDWLAQLYPDQ